MDINAPINSKFKALPINIIDNIIVVDINVAFLMKSKENE